MLYVAQRCTNEIVSRTQNKIKLIYVVTAAKAGSEDCVLQYVDRLLVYSCEFVNAVERYCAKKSHLSLVI
jgi:hypothetical protein